MISPTQKIYIQPSGLIKTKLKLSHKRHLAPTFQNKQHNYAQKNENIDENIQKTNAKIEKIKENKCVNNKKIDLKIKI